MHNPQTKLHARYYYGFDHVGGKEWRKAFQADIDKTSEVVDFLSKLPNRPALIGEELSQHIQVLGNLRRAHAL